MAAYASLVSLAQTIDKLQQDYDQDSTFLLEKQRIKCLHENLMLLQAFLEDFPEKLAKDLEARIRNAANQAEDIVEYFMSEEIESSLEFARTNQKGLRLHFDFQALNQWLREMTEEIDSIVEEAMEIKNSFKSTEDVTQPNDYPAAIASPSSMHLAPTSKDSMVGFDDDLMAIKTRLCGESSKRQIIPIFGMGGIGKTTLAKNAFDDQLIEENFQIRVWITISQDYNAHVILSNLLVSINAFNEEHGNNRNKPIEDLVYKSLKGRRYLIVMDDMWSTKAWDDVRMIFPDDHNGSCIMLTTRLYDVATYPDSSCPIHEMRCLDTDQSWNLLKQKVFARENCPPGLERIGKIIARSCRGLPLAIVMIAGVLLTVSTTQASWENIAGNVNQAINTTNDEQFVHILSLSYIHLPHHLRPCFLYMGGFPEDYEIRVTKLIKLWIAEGFLKPNGSKSSEERAENYLEDLVKRSLVMVTSRKSNGKIKSCIVHDLVRDLCVRKAEEDKFLLNVMDRHPPLFSPQHITNQRRISITQPNHICLANIYGFNIRTILFFHGGNDQCSFVDLGNLRLLKVLDEVSDIHSNEVSSIPLEVFELFHLRYLAFDYSLMNIPAAISNLQNLQTLIIHPRKKLVRQCSVVLPSEIWRMPQLRHLISFSFGAFPAPIGATSALENLQTLSEVTNFICAEETLKMIPNLKKLGITFVKNNDVRDYHLNNLVHLHQLENLKLKIHSGFQGRVNPVFPTTLKKLTLSGDWGFSWEYLGGVVGSLPNLEVLKLRNRACDEEAWETSEGEFLQLKFLLIKYSRLREWITVSNHFPSLKCLKLYFCSNLSEIPDGIGEIPTLELIEVDNRNKSLVKSAKRIQKDQQENWGIYTLQVRRARRNLN